MADSVFERKGPSKVSSHSDSRLDRLVTHETYGEQATRKRLLDANDELILHITSLSKYSNVELNITVRG